MTSIVPRRSPSLPAMASVVVVLHLIGWGLFVHYDADLRMHGPTGRRRDRRDHEDRDRDNRDREEM